MDSVVPCIVEEVTSRERFREIAGSWDALCDFAVETTPVVRHAVLDAWLDSFGQGMTLLTLLVWRGAKLVLAAPLVLRTEQLMGSAIPALASMSNSWIDRSALLAATLDPGPIDALLRHLRGVVRRLDIVSLGPFDTGSVVAALVRERATAMGWTLAGEVVLESPVLKLPGDWQQLLAQLSSSTRASVRQKLSRAERAPGVSMVVVRDASAWEAIKEISPSTWQAADGTAMTSTPQLCDFYARVIEDAAARNSLRCGLLHMEGVPVAFDFNLLDRGVLYSIKLGFRQEYASLSAGVALKAFLLRATVSDRMDGVSLYDFMGVAEPYKLRWTADIRSFSRLYLFAPRLRSRMRYWKAFVVRPWLREYVPWVWQTLKRLRGAQ